MAIEALELALKTLPPPIYVYHEIVHNKYVVDHFKSQGVTEADLKTITSTGKRNPRVTSCLDKLVRNP